MKRSADALREHDQARLAAEFHDELGQRLTGLHLDLAWLKPRLANQPAEVGARLESMKRLLDDTTAAMRRITRRLKPAMLDELGLSAALDDLATDFAARTGLTVHREIDPAAEFLPDEHALAIFRTIQESLTNTARHAHATTVCVELRQCGQRLRLSMTDDGRGVAAQHLAKTNGHGLPGIRARLRALGAQLQIESAPGRGFCLTADIPWPAAAKQPRDT